MKESNAERISDTAKSFRRKIRENVRSMDVYNVTSGDTISIKLNQNESPFDVPVAWKHEILQRLESTEWNRYPTAHASLLRNALADHLGIEFDQVVVGNGSNDLAQSIVSATVETGRNVVVPRPMFFLYEKLVKLAGGNVVPVESKPPHFQFDVVDILSSIRKSDPCLTVLTTPNNPTGREMAVADLREIVGATSGLVLIDEAYFEFSDTGSLIELVHEYDNVIIMRTFSKAASLAGVRVGYFIAPPWLTEEILKVRLPFMVNAFSQSAALTMIANEGWICEKVQRLKESSLNLQRQVGQIPNVSVIPSVTNFFLFDGNRGAELIYSELSRQGILVRLMSSYPSLRRFLRISVGTEAENRMFLSALLSILS